MQVFRSQPITIRRISHILLGSLCFLLVVSLHWIPVRAQSGINSATIAEIVGGNQVYIQNQQASVNDTARQGQRVRTGQARAQLAFNTGAIARLAPNSALTIGQKCARLQRGILLVNGAANGCTASVATGVRGTTYVLEVDDNNQTQVKVLEGEVAISKPEVAPESEELVAPESIAPLPPNGPKQLKPVSPKPKPPVTDPSSIPASTQPETPASPSPDSTFPAGERRSLEQSIVLTSGQKAIVQAGQDPLIGPMSQEEFEDLLKGALFNGYSVQIPGISQVQSAFSELFPGVPFPIDVPELSIPGLPIPSIPGLPF